MRTTSKKLLKICLNLFGLELRKFPKWEINKYVWLKELNIKSILDIGANAGQFALEINKFLPDAMIYSFEPLRNEYNKLIKNTIKIKKFKSFNIALGDTNGKTIIYSHNFSPASSLLKISDISMAAYPYIGKSNKEVIEIQKLDDFILHSSNYLEPEILIKIDVQGYEDRVIRGGENIFKLAKVIISEISFHELYEGQQCFDGVYNQLINLGFSLKGIVGPGLNPNTGLPLYADAIFMKI
jgi:FkbM family methyltransferase